MNLVKSKYKNPDKYIKRLKDDVERQSAFSNDWYEECRAVRGYHWFRYSSNITKNVVLDVSDASKSRIGQTVKIKGKVIGYKKDGRDNYVVTMELKEVRLIDD